jgi:hypothetical protein
MKSRYIIIIWMILHVSESPSGLRRRTYRIIVEGTLLYFAFAVLKVWLYNFFNIKMFFYLHDMLIEKKKIVRSGMRTHAAQETIIGTKVTLGVYWLEHSAILTSK